MPTARPRIRPRLAAFFAALALSACAQTAGVVPSASPTAESGQPGAPVGIQFSDIYIPQGAKIYVDKTMIFGTDPWYGQLALGASADANQTFDQFRRDMPGFGWQEIQAIRAPTSFITYTKDARVLTVQIQGTTLRGSDVTITVSPRESGRGTAGPAAPADSGPPPAFRPVPPAPVTRGGRP
jgi:hypothetical protein